MEELILTELAKSKQGMRLSLLCGRIRQPHGKVARVLTQMEEDGKVTTCKIVKSRGKPKIYMVWKARV